MLDEIEFCSDAAYFTSLDVLVVSDLHIGIEDAAKDSGMNIPLKEKETLIKKLENVIDEFDPSTVIFNGDILHRFGEIGRSGSILDELRGTVEDSGSNLVLIKGNHDTMLDSIKDSKDVYEGGEIVFTHGHTIHANLPESKLYVVGHDHPMIEIEMQKKNCYLYGPFRGSKVLMTPAFNPLCRGVVINEMTSRDFMSPFIRRDLNEFRVILENGNGETLHFPKLKKFRDML